MADHDACELRCLRKGTATFQAGIQHSRQACRTSSKLWHVLSSAQQLMEHLVVGYGAGTEALRMLMGCATALPVDGERMSSPPPSSVISCNAPIAAQYPTSRLPMFDASCRVYTHAAKMAAKAHSLSGQPAKMLETIPFHSAGLQCTWLRQLLGDACKICRPGCHSLGWPQSAASVPQTPPSLRLCSRTLSAPGPPASVHPPPAAAPALKTDIRTLIVAWAMTGKFSCMGALTLPASAHPSPAAGPACTADAKC